MPGRNRGPGPPGRVGTLCKGCHSGSDFLSGDEGEPVTQPRGRNGNYYSGDFLRLMRRSKFCKPQNALFYRLNRRLQKILEDLGGRALVELAIRGAELRLGIAGLDEPRRRLDRPRQFGLDDQSRR
jgi:hypothetical protein